MTCWFGWQIIEFLILFRLMKKDVYFPIYQMMRLSMSKTLGSYLVLVLFLIALVLLTLGSTPTAIADESPQADDFGLGRLEARAQGTIPVLVILLEDKNSFAFAPRHTPAHFEKLFFGPNKPNVRDFFQEMSLGALGIVPAGSGVTAVYEHPGVQVAPDVDLDTKYSSRCIDA